ncbi:unnamed protein product, partial [marine sediment metagenome]
PRPEVFAIYGAHHEAIAKAIRIHARALSPKYRVAEKLIQAPLIQRGIELFNEVTFRDLAAVAIETEIYNRRDVLEIATTILREKGVKVLR